MDMVVLTKDVRLVCLVSPSPANRSIKVVPRDETPNIDHYVDSTNSVYYDSGKNTPFGSCLGRYYDLCISSDLLNGLKLNGYIGIAFEDSLTKHFTHAVENAFQSLLFLSSCFTNEIYPRQNKINGDRFIEKMIDSRTYGIPEVVLIPYDVHSHSDEYENVYNSWTTQLRSTSSKMETSSRNIRRGGFEGGEDDFINDSHFIFKYVDRAYGSSSLDLGKNMEAVLNAYNGITKPSLYKSLQSFPLFTVLEDYVDNKDYIVKDRPVHFTEISFAESYMNPSIGKSALETNLFYSMLSSSENNYLVAGEGVAGGGVDILEMPKNIMKMKSYSKTNNSKTPVSKPSNVFDIKNRKAITFENDEIYYNEINGMPIVVYKKQQMGGKQQQIGKQQIRKQKTKKNKTKRNKTRKY